MLLPSLPPDAGHLGSAEQARAARFLAGQDGSMRPCSDDALVVPRTAACRIDEHGDIDGDGRADCWRVRHGNPDPRGPGDTTSELTVWAGCRGDGASFEVAHSGTSLFTIPHELAAPTWLGWIARRLVGPDAVACADGTVAGCAAAGPEWDWLIASADRRRAQPGWYGAVAPRWIAGEPVTTPGGLIVPYVPAGWMARYRGAEEGPPPEAPAGPRIVVEAGVPPAVPVPCAGLEIRSGRRGIIGFDAARQRWTWLFRGLPDYGGFATAKLACIDDVVIATTGGSFAYVVAIDPRTGGWLFAPSYDAGPGAEISALPDGRVLWRDEYGHVIPVHVLRDWLARPITSRPSIDALADQLRPETSAAEASDVMMLTGSRDPHGREELYGEPFASSAIAPRVRGSLAARGTCAGWTIASSPTAILAERGAQARWLYVEGRTSSRRIASVRCSRGRVLATRVEPGTDLFETDPVSVGGKTVLGFDIRRDRWWRQISASTRGSAREGRSR